MRIQNSELRIKNAKKSTRAQGHKSTGTRALVCALMTYALMTFLGGEIQASEDKMRDAMKESLVYLEISSYGYDQLRPWHNTDVVQKGGVGCAVGPYEVITPTWNLTDASLVKARRSGQNEYIPATIRAIDYEIDLALVELEPNSLKKALKPVKFADKFQRGAKLNYYWLNSASNLTTGQGYLDRAEVRRSPTSYASFLNYVVTNMSQETGIGQLYCDGSTPVGIACWNEGASEAGLIPAVVINSFLSNAKETTYPGVPAMGFSTDELLDPATRAHLKMPETLQNGVLVTDVSNLGTGSDSIKPNDVILAIDGRELDAYGKFQHREYDRISFHHLIVSHKVGDEIDFDIWRDGKEEQIKVPAKNFNVREMLVPYYEYGQQPEYVVTGGYVFQKLTRPYLTNWGKDWAGRVTPHLFYYYRDMSFKPTIQRRDIVILSYCLPAPINLGYIDLAQLVVSSVNGMPISRISDIAKAQKLNPDSEFDVVEFELDSPTVVIPRPQLPQADMLITTNYGIRKPVNID